MPDLSGPTRPEYHLDGHGLVCGWTFDGTGRARQFDTLPAGLPADGESWFWAHVDLVDRRTLRWLSDLKLPRNVLKAFTSEDTRPRVEGADGLLSGMVMEMRGEPYVQTGRSQLLRFAAGRHWLITARHHPLDDIDALRARLDRGLLLDHPLAVLALFVELSVDRFQREIEGMLASLNFIEDVVIERGGTDASPRVAEIRRKAVAMHREMALNKTALGRLAEMGSIIAPPSEIRDAIAVDHQKAEALHGELHNISERARLLKDEIASNLAMDMNKSLYIISMISALLLPPSLIFGLFGTNVGGLPFLNHDYGFWAVSALGLASAILVLLVIRRRA